MTKAGCARPKNIRPSSRSAQVLSFRIFATLFRVNHDHFFSRAYILQEGNIQDVYHRTAWRAAQC